MGLGSAIILSGQKVVIVAAQQLPELLELSQLEVVTIKMGHPVIINLDTTVQSKAGGLILSVAMT